MNLGASPTIPLRLAVEQLETASVECLSRRRRRARPKQAALLSLSELVPPAASQAQQYFAGVAEPLRSGSVRLWPDTGAPDHAVEVPW